MGNHAADVVVQCTNHYMKSRNINSLLQSVALFPLKIVLYSFNRLALATASEFLSNFHTTARNVRLSINISLFYCVDGRYAPSDSIKQAIVNNDVGIRVISLTFISVGE